MADGVGCWITLVSYGHIATYCIWAKTTKILLKQVEKDKLTV